MRNEVTLNYRGTCYSDTGFAFKIIPEIVGGEMRPLTLDEILDEIYSYTRFELGRKVASNVLKRLCNGSVLLRTDGDKYFIYRKGCRHFLNAPIMVNNRTYESLRDMINKFTFKCLIDGRPKL